MRLTTVIFIATLMQVSAAGFAQRITLKERKSQLENVLQKIHIQSGYDFVFDRKVITKVQPIDVTLKNASLEDALNQLLSGLPLTYLIDGKTILIKPKKKSLLDNLSRYFASITITGRLLDEKGLPLPGASIKVKGTNIYSITDKNGAFTLANVDENAVILISFIGYDPIELKAKANMGAISLKLIDSKLDEVQVIGYGTTTKRFSTGSVTTIKSEDIKNQTVISPIQALQGMVPGLFIQQGNGMPGASSKVSLRGTNSLSSGTVPLYIIDGVPFDGNSVERSGNTFAEQANGSSDPLNAINPQDIASIDVLKDADATAIYGARGANGVIIITTKYASSGATTISGTVYSGISKIRKFVPVLSTAEFLDIRRAAFMNDNIAPTEFNAPDLKLWSQTEDTNYQKYIMGNNAPQTDANLSVSGGNSATGLYLSGSYRKEGTVYPADYGYKRGSMHAKAYHTAVNGKFRAEFSTIYSSETNKMPSTDIANITTTYPNNYPLYNPDGTLYFHPDFPTNPLALVRSYGKTNAKTLMMNAGLQYNLLSNLKLKVNAGQNSVSQEGITIVPSTAGNPTLGTNQSGGGNYTNNTNTTYLVEPLADYNVNIAKGKLNATLGGTYQFREYKQPYFIAAGLFSSDALLENYTSAGMIFFQTNSSSQYRFASVFGRAVYNWDSKYILSGTFRRDGSSRFGPGKQYGNFGSVGAAWLFTEESFLKESGLLSFGKLRGSYGTVGNDQIQDYLYLETYTTLGTPYGNSPGIELTGVANKDYSWETTRKMEMALELGFFKDRLMLNATWFRNRSGNLLTYAPLSGQTGSTGYTANMDALVQNTGWEFDIKLTPINKASLSWNVGFNISTSTNKLVSYPGLAGSSDGNRYAIGRSLNLLAMYQFSGFQDGIAQVQDLDGDGQISQGLRINGLGDQIIAGTTDPKFFGGLTNNLKIGNFQLDLFVNFVKKDGLAPTSFPGLLKNQLSGVLDRRFTPSTSVSSPSYASYKNYYVNSDAIVVDASFIRLKNVTLSYNLPEKWTSAVKIRNCRIFASGQNLLTITNYKGYDPETAQFNPLGYPMPLPAPVFPPLLTITGGIQFSL